MKKSKEEMAEERKYTKEILEVLANEYGRTPRFIDRYTNHYRLKIGTDSVDAYYTLHPEYGPENGKLSEQVCSEIAEKFPGVLAVKAGISWVDDVNEKWWCLKVPFVKPNEPTDIQLELNFDETNI